MEIDVQFRATAANFVPLAVGCVTSPGVDPVPDSTTGATAPPRTFGLRGGIKF